MLEPLELHQIMTALDCSSSKKVGKGRKISDEFRTVTLEVVGKLLKSYTNSPEEPRRMEMYTLADLEKKFPSPVGPVDFEDTPLFNR